MDSEEPIETAPCQGQTEGIGVSMDQGSVREEFRARIKELRHNHQTLPSRYKGYEVLMDTFDDPAVNVPQGQCKSLPCNSIKFLALLTCNHFFFFFFFCRSVQLY